jgi:hypothetical protein
MKRATAVVLALAALAVGLSGQPANLGPITQHVGVGAPSWYSSPEWWLVILGFPTLAFIAVQAVILRRQTNALVNSERAWLMANVVWTADVPRIPSPTRLHVIEGDGTSGQTTAIDICLVCTNEGRTPAWITRARMWLVLSTEKLQGKPSTKNPIYTHLGPEPLSIGKSSTLRAIPTCSGKKNSNPGGQNLILYGLVEYRDVFGDHETWCGYVVKYGRDESRLERLIGLGEYNKNT